MAVGTTETTQAPTAPTQGGAALTGAAQAIGFRSWFFSLDQTKLLLAFISTLAASATTLTTYILKRHEQDMARVAQQDGSVRQRQEQQHQFQNDFLQQVIKFESKPGDHWYRRDVLSFFAAALEDGPVKQWAQEQLTLVNGEIKETERLKKQIDDERTNAAQEVRRRADAEVERDTAKAALTNLKRQGMTRASELREKTLELRARQSALDDLTIKAEKATAHANMVDTIIRQQTRNPCPLQSVLITGASNENLGLAMCAASAPASPGVQTWKTQLEGVEILCGCKPR
jgi:hypothetical protein